MKEITASRTLVKSPPELWAECSDAESLARHLGDGFGEIRITRLDPETAVAWEGEQFSGTVRLEPSGWGTKVVLTAAGEAAETLDAAAPEPVAEAVAEPPPELERALEPRRGFLARLLGRWRRPPMELEAEPAPRPQPEPVTPAEEGKVGSIDISLKLVPAEPRLTAALDSLGAAHHRPFSRG